MVEGDTADLLRTDELRGILKIALLSRCRKGLDFMEDVHHVAERNNKETNAAI